MEDAHLSVRFDYFKRGNFKAESGLQCGLELLRLKEPPTAIFSANSGMTLGLLQAIQQAEVSCPESVSILGFDDLDTGAQGMSFGSLLKPALTVIVQPGYQIGQRAAEMLLGILNNPGGVEQVQSGEVVTLKAELCVRGSVAARPAQ
jgi:LacI family transcriptional regulator